MELPNSGQVGDKHFVHCSEIVPSSEVEMYGQHKAGVLEVPLYTYSMLSEGGV